MRNPDVKASKAGTPDLWTSRDRLRYRSVCKAKAAGPVHSEAWATRMHVRKKFGSGGGQVV